MPDDLASPILWSSSGAGPDKAGLSAWCAYTGQTEQAAQNWGWLDALHPDDRATARDAWTQAVQMVNVSAVHYRIRYVDAEYQLFRILHVPLFNDARQLQAWLVFFVKQPDRPLVIDENWEPRLMNSMIFTQVVLGILCLSLDGYVLRMNARFCQFTGYTKEELLSLTVWQLSAPEDLHVQLLAMRERLSSGSSYPPFRIRYLRKNGTPIWVRVTQFLVRLPSGEPYYFFYVVEDVSSQVQAEAERAQLLARIQEIQTASLARTSQLEVIFESITDGILVCDGAGWIIQSNPAARHIMHLDQYPGYLQMSMPERTALLHAFDEQGQSFTEEQWPLARLLRGEDLRGNKAVDMHLIFPDGQEVYLNHSGSALRDQDNAITGAVLVIRDVTERRRLEKHVRKSFSILLAVAEELMHIPEHLNVEPAAKQVPARETPALLPFQAAGKYLVELTRQMLEYQGVSIALLDPRSGRFRLVATSGRSEEEEAIYYENFADFSLSDYLDESAITRLRENEMVEQEITLRTPRLFQYSVLLAPMLKDGQLVGVFSVKKEEGSTTTGEETSLVKAIAKFVLLVIEHERLQQEWIEAHTSEMALLEANRRFDEFLSIASHELRTPLAGIKGNIQLALRRLAFLKSPELPELHGLLEKLDKVYDYLVHAERRVNVQNRMISDLLDVSRIQANKLELVMRPCNLVRIAREAVEDQRYSAPERAIALHLPDEELTVFGDADRLSQVVHNYLSNALKYAPVSRPIAVCLEKQDETARVTVQDEGPGLSPEEQKHVWERFYRVKSIPTQGDASPGMGLGLHICRTIIEAHHGWFGLESTPGEGSTFWFALPLVQPEVSLAERQAPTLQEHAPGD